MNVEQLTSIWEQEKPQYEAWGNFVLENITSHLNSKDIDCDVFFKVPPKPRLKGDFSLVEKAFYREGKTYSDPYNEIEDKVGVRFVVLLIKHVDVLRTAIEDLNSLWTADLCRDYEQERLIRPLEFSYQSCHFVLRPISDIEINGLLVSSKTTCEVQVRTLLQHAHAELTHDLLYKSKKKQKPEVQRVSARSMALIETTDDFFVTVDEKVNMGAVDELKFNSKLDNFYRTYIGEEPEVFSSSVAVWDYFDSYLEEGQVEKIIQTAISNDFLINLIQKKRTSEPFYRQSVVFFAYWMLQFRKTTMIREWPLSRDFLATLAADVGVSLGVD